MSTEEIEGVKQRMLADLQKGHTVTVDGWTSVRGRQAASELEQEGKISLEEFGSDEAQYTGYRLVLKEEA